MYLAFKNYHLNNSFYINFNCYNMLFTFTKQIIPISYWSFLNLINLWANFITNL